MLFNVQISAPVHIIIQEFRGSHRQCIISVCSVYWSCFKDLSKSAFFSLFVKPRGRYQLLRTNSKTSYRVGNWHSSPSLQWETAVAWPSFLAAVTTSGWPDSRVSWMLIRTRFFYLPLVVALERTPSRCSKVRPRAGGEGQPFRWEFSDTARSPPASVVMGPSVNILKKKLGTVWT